MATRPFGLAGAAAIARAKIREGMEEEGELDNAVDSSVISHLHWKDEVVTVTFHRGGQVVYEYPCSRELYMAFVEAPSKGTFFNQHFK